MTVKAAVIFQGFTGAVIVFILFHAYSNPDMALSWTWPGQNCLGVQIQAKSVYG